MTITDILSQNPVVPVLTVDDAEQAADTARALHEGGVGIIEIALRSAAALDAITAVRRAVPGMMVGAGTVRAANDFAEVVGRGAAFAVSPGVTPSLIEASRHWDIPFLPGAATPGDIMLLSEAGFDTVKLFPTGTLGGIPLLGSLAGPFGDIRFCPSGGIDRDNFADFLRLDNVLAVSGSWLVPKSAIAQRDWKVITRLARETLEVAGDL